MLSPRIVRKEYKKALAEISELVRIARQKGLDWPIDHDYELYRTLWTIKNMLEWVDPSLVDTDPNGRSRIEQLLGDCRYYGMGPVDTEMTMRRY